MDTNGTPLNHYPRHSSDNQGSALSRGDMKSVATRIVRVESESMAAAPSPSSVTVVESSLVATPSLPEDYSCFMGDGLDNGSKPNGNTVIGPAWNKPSNGAASEVNPVMDFSSWPPLSESTRATSKSSSESSKGLTDGSSTPQLQGTGSTPLSSERPVIDVKTNNMVPTRQEPMRHNGLDVFPNDGHLQQAASKGPNPATGFHNSSPKNNTQRSGYASQTHNINDRPQQRHSFRNRSSGPLERGDGARHQNWTRREQRRGNQNWNIPRNFNGIDTHMPPGVFPIFMRPPMPPPPPALPFGGPFGYPGIPSPMLYAAAPPPESFSGVPFIPPMPPHALFSPAPDPLLHTKIVNQIHYYFSVENLIKDIYLRQNMDDWGWVPINLIAGFKRVKELTDNIQLIIDALRTSSVIEVQGNKIRRRNDWRRWIMPACYKTPETPNVRSSQPLRKLSRDKLAEKVQSISLEKTNDNDSAEALQLSAGEGTGQVGIRDTDHSERQGPKHFSGEENRQ